MALQYADVTGDLFDIEVQTDQAEADAGSPALLLRVHLQPGAGSPAVLGRRGASLALRVAPPPRDPRSTSAAIHLIASVLDLSEDQVQLASGDSGADKRLRITGIDPAVLRRQLDDEIARVGRGRPIARGGRSGR
jgi:uncharacterized protein YggU (UPF0235/DUF167 family)